MLRTTLRSLWQHKRRLISTTIAVLLGVAFMSGTFVLGDTLDNSVADLVGEVTVGIDAEVRGPELFDTGFGVLREPFDESLIEVVAEVDEVRSAGGYLQTQTARLLDAEGETIGQTNGAPTILESYLSDPELSGYEIVEGRGIESTDEMIINRGGAEDGDFAVGDTIEVVTNEGRASFNLVGIYTIAGRDTIAGAITASIDRTVVADMLGIPGQVQLVMATATEGTSQEDLAAAINAALPPDSGTEAVTGEQSADELASTFQQGLSFFSTFLLIFALIALVVGSFIIFNTFSILVAQRGRELALLRAIGSTRGQVMGSVLVEALIVGLIAALIGIGLGVLLASGLMALLRSIGLELPATTVVVTPNTLGWAVLAGVGITVASALVPAWRATRIPPIAALRDIATDSSATSRIRAVLGVIILALGLFLLIPAFGEDPDNAALQSAGMGMVVVLIAVVILGPVIARPIGRLLGWPASALRGTPGHLARENAARSPKRTASTAAALMIGVALVGFITIFAESAKASIDEQITRGLHADLIVQSESFELGIPIVVGDEIAALDGVANVISIRQGLVQLEMPSGDTTLTFMGAIDPSNYASAVTAEMDTGTLEDLVPGSVIVDARQAEQRGVTIGDTVSATFPTGASAEFTIAAISQDPQLLGIWTVTHDDWAANVPNQTNGLLFVMAEEGLAADELKPALDPIVEQYPTVKVEDRDEFLGSIASQLNSALNIVYGLLGLSVIIALIGIANTLSLSIHERTRELGLLRAVGMTRAQLRSSVRWEAAIIALLGTALGLILALAFSYTLIQALGPQGFSAFRIPPTPLVVIVVAFAALGVVASILPARRAARLKVLDAIAQD